MDKIPGLISSLINDRASSAQSLMLDAEEVIALNLFIRLSRQLALLVGDRTTSTQVQRKAESVLNALP